MSSWCQSGQRPRLRQTPDSAARDFAYSVMRAPLRAIGVLFFGQIRLKDRFQHSDRSHLCHPISDGRCSQELYCLALGSEPAEPLAPR